MKKTYSILIGAMLILSGIAISGCFPKYVKGVNNYYVLDYLSATERANLRQKTPKGKTLEVLDTNVSRAYSRNQIVVRKDNFQISYMPNDVWATRLSDAIPNVLVERIKAYNIFQKVDRDTGESTPSYYLETNVLNLEMIEEQPVSKAYVKMEFYLRDSSTQRELFNYKDARYKLLPDTSPVYFVQAINELIMEQTDVFAARCIMLLDGKELPVLRSSSKLDPAEALYYESISEPKGEDEKGELLIKMMTDAHPETYYYVDAMDEEDEGERITGVFGQVLQLEPGDYRVTIDKEQEIGLDVNIKPKMRTVIDKPVWSELTISIMDESHNKVRLGYDIYIKNTEKFGYSILNQGYSLGDDEIGEVDKVWILRPGHYMIKLGGGAWSDMRDFTTVDLDAGESKLLTFFVDPAGEGTVMLGAGVLGDDGIISGGNKIHRGALHTNISLSTKNSAAQEEPTNTFTLNAQFDNAVDFKQKAFEYSLRSLYDLGMNLTTGNDFRISMDAWSLKNTLLFNPLEQNKHFKNFAFYGRADLNTHLFDEMLYFNSPKNLILLDQVGDTLSVLKAQEKMKAGIALFPMRLKEGMGITYRFVLTPTIWMSVRGGYGWQQEFNRRSFKYICDCEQLPDDLVYEVYREAADKSDKGIESTIIFSAQNLFKFLSVNSAFDVLFPMGAEASEAKYESENRVNIKLLRNISIDIRANLIYDKSTKDYLLYDYSSYLRLSLFY